MSNRVLLTGRGALAAGLADGLAAAAASVSRCDIVAVDRPSVGAQVSAAIAELGGLDSVVHVQILAAARHDVVDSDLAQWVGCSEDALEAAIHLAQETFPALAADGGGQLVFVVPTIGMSGAAGFAGSAAAAEGIRVLAKGLAKQWGHHGIRVNTVAVAPQVMLPADLGAEVAAQVALAEPALGWVGDPAADLAPVIAALVGPQAHWVTGATIGADGGVWMGA